MKIPYWKESSAILIGLLAGALLAEGVTRLYFGWRVGPRVLLYGTDWFRNVERSADQKKPQLTEREEKERQSEWSRQDSVETQRIHLHGYNKFFPRELKSTKDVDSGERIPVTINDRGFRGRDFEVTKAPGVIRVLTMGASSTFGYYDRDNETYPYYLEQLLNSDCTNGPRFEVINFAIPHASSANIAAMFLAEGIELTPDVVTFYEGRNDSTLDRVPKGVWDKAYAILVHRLLLVAFLDQVLVGERVSITDPSLQLGPQLEDRSHEFLANLQVILDASRKAGIKMIVANQQATSRSPIPGEPADRLAMRGVTYAQEATSVRRRLEKNESITAYEYDFLIHQRLMQDLKQWAAKNDVPFVDVIGALDQRRDYLLSWVHLHPEANRIVAAKFSEPILKEFCSAKQASAGVSIPVSAEVPAGH
jgi:lysophospholipase L1-like esterase